MNFTQMKDFYVLKRVIYKNLSHVSNNHYGFGKIKQCWKALFAENFSLSHHFSESILANQKNFIQNWRGFLFLRYPSTKTYLSFFTVILQWEIHAHLYRPFFRLCKTLFYTYLLQRLLCIAGEEFWENERGLSHQHIDLE